LPDYTGNGASAGNGVGDDGFGGGVYLASGTLNLSHTLVELNSAIAGPGATASGGGVYEVPGSTLHQSGLTLIFGNSPNNISP
jgi:hypothetical protein